MHAEGTRIAMLTAYDYPTARVVDEAGVPLILVGDSLGMVMLGYEETVRVTMDEMLHHTKAVVRGTRRSLVVGDMPFLSYGVNIEHDARQRRPLHQRGRRPGGQGRGRRAQRADDRVDRTRRHPGHGPHRPDAPVGAMAWAAIACRARRSSRPVDLLADAFAVQEAGAFAVVLELVPGGALGRDHRATEDPDHRHRRRGRLLRPGAGDHGPARPDLRLHSQARASSTRTSPIG